MLGDWPMHLRPGVRSWGTPSSKLPLYAASSETWTRPVIPANSGRSWVTK